MDTQKKDSKLHKSDSSSRSGKVVLGLTFGLESLVAAYLLKIQKYDLIAVTISNHLNLPEEKQSSLFSCHLGLSKIEFLKNFCKNLNIPHIVETVGSEFEESVVDPWIADKLVGRKSRVCWMCHDLKMHRLYQKMLDLDADFVATGHYAKIYQDEKNGKAYIHTANELEFDQSPYLSRLPHKIITKLILPFSELTKKDVLKLALNFGLTNHNNSTPFSECFLNNEMIYELLAKRVPLSFVEGGELFSSNQSPLGTHKGIFNYTVGNSLSVNDHQSALVVGHYNLSNHRVTLVPQEYFIRGVHLLVKCNISYGASLSNPFNGFIHEMGNQWIECWVVPKSISTVAIYLKKPVKKVPGELVTIFKNKIKNSKVLLIGEIRILPIPLSAESDNNDENSDPLLSF